MAYAPRIYVLEPKHPDEIVDYPISLSPWVPTGDSATIVNGVTASSGLTILNSPAPAITNNILIFWVSGGTHGATYNIEVRFSTTGGRSFVADFQLTVHDPTF